MLNPFLNPERKLRNGWWIVIFFLLLAALVVPASIHASSQQETISIPRQALMVFAVTWGCITLRRESLSEVFGPPKSYVQGIPIGMALGVAIWFLAAGILWITGAIQWRVSPQGASALLIGLSDSVALVLVEELLFRGFVFRRLIAGIGTWPAQLVMAAYFLLNHWNNPGMSGATQVIAGTNIFLAGLLFGALCVRTGSLAVPIALHFALNFTQGNLLGFGVSGHDNPGLLSPKLISTSTWWTGGAFGLEASLPGTVIILGVLVAVLTWKVPKKTATESAKTA